MTKEQAIELQYFILKIRIILIDISSENRTHTFDGITSGYCPICGEILHVCDCND